MAGAVCWHCSLNLEVLDLLVEFYSHILYDRFAVCISNGKCAEFFEQAQISNNIFGSSGLQSFNKRKNKNNTYFFNPFNKIYFVFCSIIPEENPAMYYLF